MAFSREVVSAVKERADILEVIGERVRLTPSGSDYLGLCPFHGEKTPSFRVSPTWRTYHCFGCGVGGSVIDFVMAEERLSFADAVAALAARFSIPLPEEAKGEGAGRSMEALKFGQDYYHDFLMARPEGEAARMYLSERGFEEPDWKAFSLGFAPDRWQGFMDTAEANGYSRKDLLASGLVRESQSGRAFDMLRKRVVFPIHNPLSRPIAFGGRVIDPLDTPKYLNTPETSHYRKSRVLFGLAQGLETLRQSRRALLVEGYLDVMRLHQHGFREALATCGTALSEEHLHLLERHAQRVVLLFDGDEAGVKAALRCAPMFLNQGIEARVALLPDGLDPDDFLGQRGPDAFSALLDDAGAILEFVAFQLLQRNGRTVQGKEQTIDALLPMLAQVRKPAARDLTIQYLSDLVGVRSEAILAMMRGTGGRGRAAGAQPGMEMGAAGPLSQREGRHQRRVLRLLLQEPGLIGQVRPLLHPEELTDPALRRLLERMLAFSDEEFAQIGTEELMGWFPEQAPTIRELIVSEPVHATAVSDFARQLEHELTYLKDDLKEQLFHKFKSLVGSPEEETAFRDFQKVRNEVARMKKTFRVTHPPRPEVTLRGSAPETAREESQALPPQPGRPGLC